ncbi:uncharacterized protein LOC135468824 [Liolophura sinensis]|uniref:uncharacterized protein LOC135468824 n=1 Tax=Liolophura sinensis TaxID=3198878 RepID=UPI0031590C9C
MPSHRTLPFSFMDSSFLEENGIKGLGSKSWKEFASKGAGKESSMASKMTNGSESSLSAPVMPIGGQVLGVQLQQPERLVEQPVQNTFQGFQFQLPWAPHLSGFNSGVSDNIPSSSRASSPKMRSLPFDYNGRLDSSEPVYRSQSTKGKFPAIRMSSKCFNSVIKRQRIDIHDSEPSLSPMRFGLSKFQSLSKTPVKRSHSEMVQPHDESGPSRNSSDADCSSFSETSAKKKRFLRTADALQKSGLLAVTMESAALIQQNRKLQQEIEQLKQETLLFIRSVFSNPENKHLLHLQHGT